ncbi:MAG: Type 4a pilus biosis protein PilO [Acidobacteriota bacterium]|nr:Type 4a pilus biosis protein PilO [Acidobacteriota bacterium]
MTTIKKIMYGLAGLLAFSVVFFLFSFGYTSLESITAQSAQSRLEETRGKAKQLEVTSKEWLDIETSYSGFKDLYLMKSDVYSRFKQDLEMLARKNAVNNSRFTYQYKSIFTDVVKITVNTQMSGAYENIKRFIFDLENFKDQEKTKIVLIKKVKLEKMKNGNMVEGELTMEAYFVK